MTIQLNTDKNISGNAKLEAYVNATIADELSRFSDHITRVEVHLSDENGSKVGKDDKRCMMEVRLEGRKPFAVSSNGNTVDEALTIAIKKAKTSMDTIFGRLKNH